MKIFRTSQIKQIDAITIQDEPISSYNLMKRASRAFFEELLHHIEANTSISVFAGNGNNGGDALVIAQLLNRIGKNCHVYLIDPKDKLSEDCQNAYDDLRQLQNITRIKQADELPSCSTDIIIDGLFGTGLNRPVEGVFKEVIHQMNLMRENGSTLFSIDIPSGLFGEDNQNNHPDCIIKADYTFTFQAAKPCFFFAENEQYVGDWKILDIQLHPQAIAQTDTPYYLTDEADIKMLYHKRNTFSHKGTFGHALLIAGSYGMMGASILATKAALRTGCGLVTVHIPQKGYEIMQISVPEAIVSIDQSETCFTRHPNLTSYNAIGIGPGVGQSETTATAIHQLLSEYHQPMVIDADALNLMGKNPEWWSLIPPKSILTPHPKEFERIAGVKTQGYNSWEKQRELSRQHNVIIVLKGAYTSISFPDGTLHVNPTGNPGMATAGSGDTLTGILTSLLAQKYAPEKAALLGVWLHGKAGDLSISHAESEESMIASDLISQIGTAFKGLRATYFPT